MHIAVILSWCALIVFIPCVGMVSILIYYLFLRFRIWLEGPMGRRGSMIRTCGLALGMMFQFFHSLYQPGAIYAVEQRQDDDAGEDDQGDPETPEKHLHRQLRRIRRASQLTG